MATYSADNFEQIASAIHKKVADIYHRLAAKRLHTLLTIQRQSGLLTWWEPSVAKAESWQHRELCTLGQSVASTGPPSQQAIVPMRTIAAAARCYMPLELRLIRVLARSPMLLPDGYVPIELRTNRNCYRHGRRAGRET
jgi:hypothetical protein